jgi:hypothetical protein
MITESALKATSAICCATAYLESRVIGQGRIPVTKLVDLVKSSPVKNSTVVAVPR